MKKYPGAVYKSFQDCHEADSFVSGNGGNGGRANGSSDDDGFSARNKSSSRSQCVSSARERYSGNFTGGTRR